MRGEGTPDAPRTSGDGDPVGEAIRRGVRDIGLPVGVFAGAVVVAVPWLVVFGLSFVPGHFLRLCLNLWWSGGRAGSSGRLAAALFAPWLSPLHMNGGGGGIESRSASLPAAAVLLAVLTLVGIVVRRTARTFASRTLALATCVAVATLAVTVAALVVSYRVDFNGRRLTASYDTLSMLLVVPLWLLLVAPFAFGVVRLVHRPLAEAWRAGLATVAVIAVAAAAAFSIVIASWRPYSQDGKVVTSTDVARTLAHFDGSVAAAAVPLAFGAKAHLYVDRSFTDPFETYTDVQPVPVDYNIRLPRLERYMRAHPDARITGYASTGALGARLLILAAALLCIAGFVLATALVVRRVGAPRALDGMRHGVAVGIAASVGVIGLTWIASLSFGVHGGGQFLSDAWTVHPSPLLQTCGELIVLCALTGLLVAALAPRPYSYEPWRWRRARVAPSAAALSEGVPSPTADAPVALLTDDPVATAPEPGATEKLAPLAFCAQCGAKLTEHARFCARCGAPVATP